MRMSKHALTRCHQRGVGENLAHLVYDWADGCRMSGSAELMYISHQQAQRMHDMGWPGTQVARMRRLVLVADQDGTCITVLPGRMGRRALTRSRRLQ
jgi:hypothetical protein